MDMATQSGETALPRDRRRRVLVVDDEPYLAKTLQILLSEEYDVVVVASGSAARAQLETDREFDAILCDLVMPGVSGRDVHAWLRERAPELAARIVFMTGGAYTADARDLLASVPNPRIEKPFRLEDVQALIERVASA